MDIQSIVQTEVVNRLISKGWTVNTTSQTDDEEFTTVFMSKRISRSQTRYAEIDGEGLVNGMAYNDWNNKS